MSSFCISIPNAFLKLCAVVITTRYQLGNLYANGIGLGLMSLLYHCYTTGPGCHGNARLLPRDMFTFRDKVFKDFKVFLDPQFFFKRLRCEQSVLPDKVGMTRVELVWSNKLVLCCLTQLPAGRHTTRGSGGREESFWSEVGRSSTSSLIPPRPLNATLS